MYFKFSLRKHPQSGKLSGYYRLVESYRNADNRVCHRTILNVGFIEELTAEQLNQIQKQLTEKYEHKQPVFQREDDPIVRQ
jgi:F0F1-type ATP synthase delta subunit